MQLLGLLAMVLWILGCGQDTVAWILLRKDTDSLDPFCKENAHPIFPASSHVRRLSISTIVAQNRTRNKYYPNCKTLMAFTTLALIVLCVVFVRRHPFKILSYELQTYVHWCTLPLPTRWPRCQEHLRGPEEQIASSAIPWGPPKAPPGPWEVLGAQGAHHAEGPEVPKNKKNIKKQNLMNSQRFQNESKKKTWWIPQVNSMNFQNELSQSRKPNKTQ